METLFSRTESGRLTRIVGAFTLIVVTKSSLLSIAA
jgi:hypothetical protein